MTDTRARIPAQQTGIRQAARGVAAVGLGVALGGDAIRNAATFGGYVAIVLLTIAAVVVVLVRLRPSIGPRQVPWPLAGFVGLAALSLVWSAYPSGTAATLAALLLCTVLGAFLALALSWTEVLEALARATGWLLGLSLAFELVVAAIVRGPVLPVGVAGDPEEAPLLALWSRALLFEGGRIQGLLGNANLLGTVAVIGGLVACLRLADARARRRADVALLALALVTTALSRSGTMLLAIAAILAAVLVVRFVRRGQDSTARVRRTALAAGAVAAAGVAALLAREQLPGLFGKSADLTGRGEIWATVAEAGRAHPILGGGWSSPWAPWEPAFADLVVRHDVLQLQAHNAWLDAWFQLGWVGVALLAAATLAAGWRSWFRAVDRPRLGPRSFRPYSATSMAPLLLLVLLLVQSATESRLLMESGWVLLVLIAVKTKSEREIVPDADRGAGGR